MLDRIVVPLDGSALAESALPLAVAIASSAGATLEAMIVTAPRRVQIVTAPSRAVVDFISSSGLHARPYLKGLTDRVWRALQTRLETTITQGNVVEQLVEHTSAPSDLIVLTTHGHSGIKRAAFGSVATALIRAARAPVLLVPARAGTRLGKPAALFHRVLVALDDSDHSEEVLPYAVGLGRLVNADYMLVEVVVTPRQDDPRIGLNGQDEAYMKDARADALAHVARVAQRLEKAGLGVTTAVVDHGSAAEAILEFAESTGADLLALTTHGRTGVRRLMMGSIAEQIVRASDVPVLLYHPRK